MNATLPESLPHSGEHGVLATALVSLCDCFDDELERQQSILEICRAQGEAARAQDREALEDRAVALALLIQDAVKAEKKRLALVHEVVRLLALGEDRQTLSGLIAVVGQPWKLRMQEFQVQMRATLAATRETVRENNLILRRSLRVVNQTLASVSPAWAGGQQYTAAGLAAAAPGTAELGRMDRRG